MGRWSRCDRHCIIANGLRRRQLATKNEHDRRSAGCGRGIWSFSLAFYARPCAPAALIALQDGAGCDANLILFAIWLGLVGSRTARRARGEYGRPCASSDPRRRDRAVAGAAAPPQTRCRRRHSAPASGDQGARDRSRKSGARPARHLAGPASDGDPVQRLTDAKANLALYLALRKVSGAQAAIIENELKRFAEEGAQTLAAGSPQRLTVPLSRPNRSRTRPKV